METSKSAEENELAGDSLPSTSKKITFKTEENIWHAPFEKGWRREVVFRGTSDPNPRKKPPADTYYYAPCGAKLRSMPEVLNYLADNNVQDLQLANFTFMKETIYHPPEEITRQAQQRGAPPGSRAGSGPGRSPVMKTPKAKKRTPAVSPLVPGFESTPLQVGVSPVTPSPEPSNNFSPVDGIITTKRWRKRKALPPDFISTDEALSTRTLKEQPSPQQPASCPPLVLKQSPSKPSDSRSPMFTPPSPMLTPPPPPVTKVRLTPAILSKRKESDAATQSKTKEPNTANLTKAKDSQPKTYAGVSSKNSDQDKTILELAVSRAKEPDSTIQPKKKLPGQATPDAKAKQPEQTTPAAKTKVPEQATPATKTSATEQSQQPEITGSMPAETRRSARMKVLKEKQSPPGPPVLKKEKLCSSSVVRIARGRQPKSRTSFYTRKKNLFRYSGPNSANHFKARMLPYKTGAPSSLHERDTKNHKNDIKCRYGGKNCRVNGDLKMPCLKPMTSPKNKRRRRHLQQTGVTRCKILIRETDDDDSSSDLVPTQQDMVNSGLICETVDPLSQESSDYDSDSVETDLLFLKTKFLSNRPLISPDLDGQLHEFFLSQSVQGLEVSDECLMIKSQEIAVSLGFKNFLSSHRFVELWRQRMNIVHNSERNELKTECPLLLKQNYVPNFKSLKTRHNYSNNNTGSVYLSQLAGHLGSSQRFCSVLICALSTGAKHPAFVVFDKVDISELNVPSNMVVTSTSGTHISLEVTKQWASQVWGIPKDPWSRRLLILYEKAFCDLAVAEWCLGEYRTDVVSAPDTLNLTWAKDFEVKLLRQYDKFLIRHGSDQSPKQQDLVDWISSSWQSVNEEDIIMSYQAFSVVSRMENSRHFHETDHTYDIRHASGTCFVEVYSESSDEAFQET